ncbi:hypothetical protein [Pilimelia columellifera]|uniref:Guanylate cyclase domain-containing protein n=1 Tax=Pilimelia columellifera subsp. columellifera TaxID=706583 RepID=A0ABN3NNC1_9ACTN
MQFTPYEQSRPLPPYQAILAVDAAGFTSRPGSSHDHVAQLIPTLVGEVVSAAGMADEWASRGFFGHTGDGFAAGLPTRCLPYLIHPFPDLLQQRLDRLRRETGDALRLRVAVHVGPLPTEVGAYGVSGNGDARNDTHRLLDCDAVKDALARNSARVTLVALVISDRVFHDVVDAGYAGLHIDHFRAVTATVAGKSFQQPAWVYVPAPSGGGGDAPALAGDAVRPDGAPAATPARARASVQTNHGQVIDRMSGTMHIGRIGAGGPA